MSERQSGRRFSLFIVAHPDGSSHEVAFTEALAIDKAIVELGLEVVGGSYAQDGDAHGVAMNHVMGDEDA